MIPSWLIIGIVTVAVALIANRLSSKDIRWFKRLNRPNWLTFEGAIPFIWMLIFICGAWSAYIVWERTQNWLLMGFYLVVEIAIVLYTPVMCKLRSLRAGTIIGIVGFILGLILTIQVFLISFWAGVLLLPYLVWSPVGSYVTWKMIPLNPTEA